MEANLTVSVKIWLDNFSSIVLAALRLTKNTVIAQLLVGFPPIGSRLGELLLLLVGLRL